MAIHTAFITSDAINTEQVTGPPGPRLIAHSLENKLRQKDGTIAEDGRHGTDGKLPWADTRNWDKLT